VCGFLFFIKKSEDDMGLSRKYPHAVKRANTIGGRKFHNKQYGGGIVFESYSLPDLCRRINRLMEETDGAK
jgi:hypothetical protein